VAVGQLLFLRHAESQKEIVTRVLRQRSFGTAVAYVELEFTEVVLDFWGKPVTASESDPTDAAPSSATSARASVETDNDASHPPPAAPDRPSFIADGDDTHRQNHESRPAHAAPVAADAEEVARLREELAGLRSQMSSMLQPNASAAAEESAPSEDRSSSVASKMLASKLDPAAEFADADADSATAPRESVAQFPPSAGRGGVRVSIGLIAALLILGLVAASAYFNGFLKDAQRNVSASDVNVSGSGRAQPKTTTHSVSTASGVSTSNHGENFASKGNTSSGAERTATGIVLATADRNNSAQAPSQDAAPESNRTRLQEAADRALQGVENEGNHLAAVLRNSNNQPVTPVALKESVEESYEPPSLIKAVNAVPPADATRGFVTGDVKFEAVIDTSGKVESAKVLSGPEPLREAALEALKHYQYKPATKNGQSVAARLPVTVKFWYEP
jgi:TonB family protein